jgi:predicted short-subunit dehydrogenase-like oxidoreductase (DUF2520 family)
MKIVLIGSGNVATHLANAFHKVGLNIVQVWSRNLAHASALATQVGAQTISSLEEVDVNADFCILSIKDESIVEISRQLSHFKGIIAHTSGATDIDIFKENFINYGVFYPLQTFSKQKQVDFRSIPLCLEANNPSTLLKLEELAKTISQNIKPINSNERKVLHLAAVFACNFPNYLYGVASNLLTDNGLEFNLLRPLILETAEKVMQALPQNVQTGPAVRNDEQTMGAHLKMLENQPEMVSIYKLLSDGIKMGK